MHLPIHIHSTQVKEHSTQAEIHNSHGCNQWSHTPGELVFNLLTSKDQKCLIQRHIQSIEVDMCRRKKKSFVVSFLPLCFLLLPLILFFILTVSHNLALCCISVSLYFSLLANDVSALCSTSFVSLPFSSLLFSFPFQYFSLYAHPFQTSPSLCHLYICSPHPFHFIFPSILLKDPSAVAFVAFFFPVFSFFSSPPPHFTHSHKGTAVGDRPAEITVLLF